MSYLGDFYLGSNIDHKFTTVNTSGVPTILTGSPAVVVYPDNSTTEITSGITLTTSFDGRTGLNHIRVAATGGNGYATGTNYSMVLSTGTVGSGGTYIGGYMIGEFSIEARAALRPSSDGRDIVLSSAGFVDINDKTGFSLSSPQTFNWLGNWTGTWTGLHLGDTVGNNTGTWIGNLYGNVTGSVQSVQNPVGISTGTLLDAIADKVWDEQLGAHLVTGSAGNKLNSAASAGDPWSTNLPGSYGVGQAGYIVGTNLDTLISSRMASGTVVVGTNNDKTGYSLSSLQNFNWIGNHTGTWVGLHQGDTVGNTTGTWMGNISGTLGVINGLTPSRLDVNVSSRMPSGTVIALVTGTVNANVIQWLSANVQSISGDGFIKVDLKSIDDELTNGNNATLNLKQLNIQNSSGDAILGISSSGKGLYLQGNGVGGSGLYIISTDSDGVVFQGNTAGIFIYGSGYGMEVEGGNNGLVVWGDGDNAVEFESFALNGDALKLIGTGIGKSLNAPQGILGDIVGNITGTLIGNIYGNLTGSVGNVFGLNPSYIDTYISSRMPSGTVTAFVTGSVNVIGLNPAFLDTYVSSRMASGTVVVSTNNDKSGYGLSTGTLLDAISDKVWDEQISGHLITGSTGEKLNSAGSSGDPWATLLPGLYGAGTAGNIVGNNLDVPVSSRLASGTFAANYVTPPTASQNATEVLNQASANPIDANVQQVNDVDLQGDGSTTPWGPV